MRKKTWMYLIINMILFAEFVYIGYTNFMAILAHNPKISHDELFYMLLSVIAVSFVLGVYSMLIPGVKKERKLREYQRELERRGVDRDESSSKIKVLESKIVVLEKALQDALNGQDK